MPPGRKRFGKELMVPIAIQVDPELKEAMLDEAYRTGKTLSQMAAYGLQRWINAHKHTKRLEEMRK